MSPPVPPGARRPVYLSLFLVMLTGLPVGASAAPQTFNTALPVAEGQYVLRGQFFKSRASHESGSRERTLDVEGGIAVLGRGITEKLAAFAAASYLDKSLDLNPTGGEVLSRGAGGLGDTRLFTRYTVLQRDWPGRTLRLAPFVGLKLPTGEDDRNDRSGRFPRPLQPGSGSWDPFGGLVVSYQTLAYQVDAQIRYQANTEAGVFEFGDEFRFDASLQYRLWPRDLGSGVPGFLYGVIESNLQHVSRNTIAGVDDADSGGTELLLSPGLQYVTKQWIIEAIVQIPVIRKRNGAALESDYTVRAGLRLNF